jgi:hypothetical protein
MEDKEILRKKDKMKEYDRQYRILNKDKIRERKRNYRIENKDMLRAYALRNLNKTREYEREYRLRNKDKLDDYESLYRSLNKSKKRDYDVRNKRQIEASTRQYYLRNKDRIKDSSRENYIRQHVHPAVYSPRQASFKSWKSAATVREYFESISNELSISHFSDWYRVSNLQIRYFGGMSDCSFLSSDN